MCLATTQPRVISILSYYLTSFVYLSFILFLARDDVPLFIPPHFFWFLYSLRSLCEMNIDGGIFAPCRRWCGPTLRLGVPSLLIVCLRDRRLTHRPCVACSDHWALKDLRVHRYHPFLVYTLPWVFLFGKMGFCTNCTHNFCANIRLTAF